MGCVLFISIHVYTCGVRTIHKWLGYRESHRRLHQGARVLEGHLPVTGGLDNQAGSRLGRRLLGHQEAKEGSSRSAHEIHLRDGSKCDTPFRRICSGPWKSQQIRVLHIGWQPCPWKPTDLLCPKEPLGMPYAFDTGGHRPICRYTVHAESRSSPTMRSLVAQEDTRSCGTMKCATWQQVCLATCAVMYRLSPPLFLCLVRPSFTDLRMCLPR